MFEVFEIQRSQREWMALEGQIWVTWSIFNPNGSTLYCLGVAENGSSSNNEAPGSREVFFRWMHFLGGKGYVLGYMDADEPNPNVAIGRILLKAFEAEEIAGRPNSMLVNSIPSWVWTGSLPVEQCLVIRDLLARAPGMLRSDWGRERYLLGKYGPDLFARAGEEYREAYERARLNPENASGAGATNLELMKIKYSGVSSFAHWTPDAYQSQPLRKGDVEAWWVTINQVEFLKRAVTEFAEAWVGAVHLSGHSLPAVETFDDAREFLAHMKHPIWPQSWTTQSLLDDLNPGGAK
jgi:hypothetical protein